MGIVINYKQSSQINSYYGLIIYSQNIFTTKDVYSANKPLAAELIKCSPTRRILQLEQLFVQFLRTLPEQPVVQDIDVLFNPAYKVDVMKVLVSAHKQKPYSLIWPGGYADGKLTYSEEGYPDYRVYEINDYDIMYVI